MSVQEYIDKHDLSKKVEEVINACVKAKPEEPISFMVRSNELPHVESSSLSRCQEVRCSYAYNRL